MIDRGKYAFVCPDTVSRLEKWAAERYASPKEADKAVKTALHQITGAFMTPAEVKTARRLLQEPDADAALQKTLALHASTRERLGHIGAFYDRLFSGLEVKSALDLACGLNPLYLGGLGLKARGVDISGKCVELINAWAQKLEWDVSARCDDLLCGCEMEACDIALCMKLLPVIERQEKGGALRLLRRVPAPLIAVTFPTATLGGRRVGMERHYSERFEPMIQDDFETLRREVIFDELTYIIRRRRA